MSDAVHRAGDGGLPIPVGSAGGFGDHFIYEAQFEKIF